MKLNQNSKNVGILKIEVYFPKTYVDQSNLEKFDNVAKGKYTIGLGQNKMAVVSEAEDSTTMSLTCIQRQLQNNHINPVNIGRLEIGTETIHDHSKSIKTDIMDFFAVHNNHDIEGVTTYNACYGGTQALFNSVAWIESSVWDGRFAIVVMSDIAVYSRGAARPTGGAGAIALQIGPNAGIVQEPVRSTHMENAYDFYKANLRTEYPIVDGKISIECYIRALTECYKNFKVKSGNYALNVDGFDYLCFHSPFTKQIYKGLLRMVYDDIKCDNFQYLKDTLTDTLTQKELKLLQDSNDQNFHDRNIQNLLGKISKKIWVEKSALSTFLGAEIGNIYTGSLYIGLASVLINLMQIKNFEVTKELKIGMFSYGSGLAASFFQQNQRNQSPFKNQLFSIDELNDRLEISPEEFDECLQLRETRYGQKNITPIVDYKFLWKDQYIQSKIDNKYKRIYKKLGVNSSYIYNPNSLNNNERENILLKSNLSNLTKNHQNRISIISKHITKKSDSTDKDKTKSDNTTMSKLDMINLFNLPMIYRNSNDIIEERFRPDNDENPKENNNKTNCSKKSSFDGFYKKAMKTRHEILQQKIDNLSIDVLSHGGLTNDYANLMIENCVGKISLPLGLGLNFLINAKSYSIPMAVEEPSVIAAASSAAKFIALNGGGFFAWSSKPVMIGQVQLLDLDVETGQFIIEHNSSEILKRCNKFCENMVNRGGGVFDFRCKKQPIPEKYRFGKKFTHMLIFEFFVNVCDSMGANIVNTIAEGIAPYLSILTKARLGIKILSNLSTERRTISFFRIPIEKMAYKNFSGREVSQKILEAYLFAKLDPYRATTHNKGIMNGIDAVAIATGQDWRAIEAGVHAYYSSKSNSYNYKQTNSENSAEVNQVSYSPLTTYDIKSVNGIEYFCGYLEIPLAIGSRGGAINSNPAYKNNLKILGKPDTGTLAQIITSVGLAQNFSALRALAIEGIQKGHMTLHAKNIAISVGVDIDKVDDAVRYMLERNSFIQDTAREFLIQVSNKTI